MVAGKLELGARSTVGEDVSCKSAIIGSHTRIKGLLHAVESLIVCDNAKVRSIHAGGDVILRPGVQVGEVQCEETIFVYGKIKSGRLIGRNVKVLPK